MNELTQVTSDIYLSLTYDDPAEAIKFLCKSFGFNGRLIVPGPDGGVVHSELTLGNAVVMVSGPKPQMQRFSPKSLSGVHAAICMFIQDPDAHHAIAVAGGATIVQEVADEDFGSRGYMARDPEGQLWYFGNYRPGEHWKL
jgi:uncharacterized glyoxalase superfamily protein PhnB